MQTAIEKLIIFVYLTMPFEFALESIRNRTDLPSSRQILVEMTAWNMPIMTEMVALRAT